MFRRLTYFILCLSRALHPSIFPSIFQPDCFQYNYVPEIVFLLFSVIVFAVLSVEPPVFAILSVEPPVFAVLSAEPPVFAVLFLWNLFLCHVTSKRHIRKETTQLIEIVVFIVIHHFTCYQY